MFLCLSIMILSIISLKGKKTHSRLKPDYDHCVKGNNRYLQIHRLIMLE